MSILSCWFKGDHDDFSPPTVGSEGPGWGFLFARSDAGKSLEPG